MCRGKILIAEDDICQLDIFKHDFEDAGYTVLGFTDGADVVDMVHKEMPDVVILDIQLPRVDGWEIARRLNSNHETRHIPVVIVSGLSLEEAKGHVMLHGCIDFLEKPVHPEAIMNRIDKYIRIGSIKRKTSDMLEKVRLYQT